MIEEARKEIAARQFTVALEVLRKAEEIDPLKYSQNFLAFTDDFNHDGKLDKSERHAATAAPIRCTSDGG